VVALAQGGNLRKAIDSLGSGGIAQGNEDTVRQLEELLNPIPLRPVWACTNPDHAPRPAQLPKKEVVKIARGTPKKAADDAFGWTYEHIQALLGDEEASTALTTFINHMQGGRLNLETMLDLSTIGLPLSVKVRKGRSAPSPLGPRLNASGSPPS